MLNLIRLLDLDADAYAVDAWLDKHPLVLVARNRQRGQEDFRGRLRLDLGNVVTLGSL
jgi:hypothetical protein